MAVERVVFTIGHSTHPREFFLNLLLRQYITALGDVRSVPYSRLNPQFNREPLKEAVRPHGIKYVFLGKELGARSEDPTCYENGRVQYDRLARSELFTHGLERVQKGSSKYRLALMCAEREPLDCHRTILIARQLVTHGIGVRHIHADGTVETQDEALKRLMRMLHVSEEDMFRSREDLFAEAYLLQEKKIAYEVGRHIGPNDSTTKAAE
jgi:uncharacterized protein (DUF488 family)